jgi:predicted 3-demethylubiquinone-9 3-methyltransferase (glyoxalase superfamily)
MQKITPYLWFDTEGEDAARFYTSVFPNSRIVEITRYGSAGPRPEGSVMTVGFELDGQKFVALNGGPEFNGSHPCRSSRSRARPGLCGGARLRS